MPRFIEKTSKENQLRFDELKQAMEDVAESSDASAVTRIAQLMQDNTLAKGRYTVIHDHLRSIATGATLNIDGFSALVDVLSQNGFEGSSMVECLAYSASHGFNEQTCDAMEVLADKGFFVPKSPVFEYSVAEMLIPGSRAQKKWTAMMEVRDTVIAARQAMQAIEDSKVDGPQKSGLQGPQ